MLRLRLGSVLAGESSMVGDLAVCCSRSGDAAVEVGVEERGPISKGRTGRGRRSGGPSDVILFLLCFVVA